MPRISRGPAGPRPDRRCQVDAFADLIVKGLGTGAGNQNRGDFHRQVRSARTRLMKLFLDTADVAVIKDIADLTGLGA